MKDFENTDFKYVLKKDGYTIESYKIKNLEIGKDFILIGGPCSIESEEQIMRIGKLIKKFGGNVIRGGAFKPRTSPYSFQGLGIEGLKLLKEAGSITGLPVVSEIMDVRDLETAVKYIDIVQVGARNAQNYSLLKELGNLDIPVILKNGLSTTISEWLYSAEYLISGGNRKVILCERGIRSTETFTRNTLDLSAVAAIKELSFLPIIIDPSHGTGKRELIEKMSLSGVMAGCDGIMIEVHDFPEQAFSDWEQALLPDEFSKIIKKVNSLVDFRKCLSGTIAEISKGAARSVSHKKLGVKISDSEIF